MRLQFSFRAEGDPDGVAGRIATFLAGEGYQRETEEGRLRWNRGSPLARLLSPMIEDWPTTLQVSVLDIGGGGLGVVLHYAVQSGLHLVGALDRLVLGTEAALLEEFLRSGRRRPVAEAVAPVRRPVVVAVVLNMILATLVVAVVGIVAGYPPWLVALAAFAVALLDGLVIVSFADLLLAGSVEVPRLKADEPGTIGSPSPTPGEGREGHLPR